MNDGEQLKLLEEELQRLRGLTLRLKRHDTITKYSSANFLYKRMADQNASAIAEVERRIYNLQTYLNRNRWRS